MANIRCPMCSKFNPPDAEVCSYCGARLKPVRPPTGGLPATPTPPAPSQPRQEVPPPAAPSEEEPDWLRQLRADEPPRKSEPAEPKRAPTGPLDDGAEVPDWLARIRGRAQDETPEVPTPGGEQETGSDWLNDLQGEAQSEPGLDDWLDRLPGAQPSGAAEPPASKLSSDRPGAEPQMPFPAETFSGSETSETESSTPDWLRSFAEETSSGQEESGGPFSGMPQGSEQSGQPSPEPPVFGQEDDFSWLDRFKAEEEKPAHPPEQESSAGFGLTGFFSGLEPSKTPSPEESAPQWSGPEEGAGQDTPSSGFGLTGFLSNLEGTDTPQPTGPEPGKKPAEEPFTGWDQSAEAAGGEVPDWLRGMESGLPEQPADENVPGAEPAAPDWLRSFSEESPAEPPAETSAQPFVGPVEESPAEGEIPDWLAGFNAPQQSSEQPQAEQPAAEQPSSTDLPDWLGGAFFTQPEAAEGGAELPEANQPTEPPAEPLPESEELPDWFTQAAQADVSSGVEEQQPVALTPDQAGGEAEPSAEEEGPSWLREFQAQSQSETSDFVPPLSSEEETLEPAPLAGDQLFTEGLPEWLNEDAAAKPAEAQEQPVEMRGEELAQADLPDWVKEMRPIESIIPGETSTTDSDQHVEKAGPLAGMRGVLPAEEPSVYYRKPAVYSSKLRVSEKQRSQASLLETIIAEETHPLLIPPKRAQTQGLLLRVLVAILLVVALLIPFLPMSKLDPLALPALYPADMLQMFDTIDKNLQSDSPVLLAVDYEPALSGEMRLASSAVVEHLMAKNARIVMVSTVPAGPALGQQLLQDAAAAYKARTQKEYTLADQTLNLGYLPGGTISLLEFAMQPRKAAPATLEGADAWNDTFLQPVKRLGDFSQVIVLTDRAETGRAWVEQAKPQLGKIPLFMVTSAQAAPLMAPYVESGQVSGSVGGMLGGAMYAGLSEQKNDPALQSLAAYQVGVILAIVVVLVGGAISAGKALMKRNDGEEE